MSRQICVVVMLLTALALVSARGQEPAGERHRIEAERGQLEARFAAEDAACRERFEVTRCVDEVKARRREALGRLRQQELRLADAERRQRAAARMLAIEAKRIDAESRPPAPPQPAPVLRRVQPPRASAVEPHDARRHDAQEAIAAAQRASAAGTRRAAAADDRSRIAERESQRDSEARKSAPLPLPPEVAASSRSR